MSAGVAGDFFQLVACPENRSFGAGIETLGVEQRALVVVSQQADVGFHEDIDALARIWPVADNISQTEDSVGALLLDIGKDRV